MPSSQVPRKVIWRKRLGLVKNLFIFALVLLIGYQTYAVQKLQKAQAELTEQQISQLESKLNDLQGETGGVDTGNELEKQLFGVVGQIGQSQAKAQRLQAIEARLGGIENDVILPAGLVWENLVVVDEATANRILAFSSDTHTAEFVVSQPDKQIRFKNVDDFDVFVSELTTTKWEQLKRLATRKANLITNLVAELEAPQTQQLMADKSLTWDQRDSSVEFLTNDGISLLTIAADPVNNTYFVNEKKSESFSGSALSSKVSQLLVALDTRSELEKLLDQQRADFEAVLDSEAFKAALKESQLDVVSQETKPDGVYYYFQSRLTDDGFTIILEHGTGLVKLVKDGNVMSLDEFLTQDKKKTIDIPASFAGQSVGGVHADKIVLLAGKHGSLTDTLMLAFINDADKTVKLVSLPRDLWWKEQKINSYFMVRGMPYLVEQLEQIIKADIDDYVLIDMYAFIDVINILGGVDITLEEAVIDPSYKVFDDGKWGTLHYEPGTYHLNGTQALRLARSRHYSSDFARAERQQQILKALQKKAQDLSLRDLPKIISLAKAVLSQVETNVGLTTTIDYYKKYKNYNVVNSGVLSSGNILYSTYSNQAGFEACLAAGGADCSKGAYILLPRDNNWQAIPWYVNQLVN